VLNVDDTCPSTLKNQQYVQYIFQGAPRGLVTLDFNQNGDYYISDAVRCMYEWVGGWAVVGGQWWLVEVSVSCGEGCLETQRRA
jgi:hypothetical protein